MMAGPIRAVLFDAVGTLIFPQPAAADVYHAAGGRFGSQLSLEEVARRFRRALVEQEEIDRQRSGNRTSQENEVRRWRSIVGLVFDDVGQNDQPPLFEELWAHFARPESWRVFDDVADCWRELESRGLLIGIASNFDERLPAICRDLPPLDSCRCVFVSSELGFKKPATEFFGEIERRLRVSPQELLLVGDDWSNDVRAARAAGWHSLLLDRNSRDDRRGIQALGDLGRRLANA